MHWEQLQFVRSVKHLYPARFKGVSVLEIGSYNINGSIRSEFDAASYVGVDLIEGPGVDVVASGHLFASPTTYDVVISTECFEHNPFYAETFLNMVRHTREGGMVLFTCASDGRAEHGTTRSEPESSPGTQTLGGDYYRNLNASDFDTLAVPEHFSEFRFLQNNRSCDLYFVGFKRTAGKLDQLTYMTTAIERLPGESDAAYELLNQGQREEALAKMASVCDAAPFVARSHFLSRQAWLQLRAQNPVGARESVKLALELGESAELHWQLGTILHVQGDLPGALEAARKAVAGDPSNPNFAYFLGAILQLLDQLGPAEDALRRALEINPKLGVAHHQLSLVRMKQKRWPEALEHAEYAAALAPNEGWIGDHLERLRGALAEPQ